MKMQDKEFDSLFRSKLNDFEAEPSGHVWAGISAGLDGRRRTLTTWLSIAASIIVLAAAGLLFIPQKGAVKPGAPDKNNIAKVQPHEPASPVQPQAPVKTQPQTVVQQAQPVNLVARIKKEEISPRTPVEATVSVNAEQVEPKEQPVLAAVSQRETQITPVVPGNETALAVKPAFDGTALPETKQITAANVQPSALPVEPEHARPKQRVHGIGGLLNAVIARVDKRKDKIIEFTASDDDESSITGVNLGILKFKKEAK